VSHCEKQEVYPNPVKAGESVTIEIDSDFSKSVIEIYNNAGISVAKHSGNSRHTKVRMPDTSGIYLVKITLSNTETQIIKIIVE